MKKLAAGKLNSTLFALTFMLFASIDLRAQHKLSLDINLGVLQSIGKDLRTTYISAQQNRVAHYSRLKFQSPYLSLLPNINYEVTSRIVLGMQSGIYAHFNERYSGYRNPVFVTVPLMVTSRITLAKFKSNSLGLSAAGGRNFFHMRSFPLDRKHGWIYNASAFYLLKKKNIFKLGIEKQVDNSFYTYTEVSPSPHAETFNYKLNRVAVVISYGFIIKNI